MLSGHICKTILWPVLKSNARSLTYASPVSLRSTQYRPILTKLLCISLSHENANVITTFETKIRCCSNSSLSSPAPTPELEQKPASNVEVKTSDSSVLPDKLYKTIELELLAYEPATIDSYQWFILTAASHLGIKVEKVWSPRKSDKARFPLLKSAHIHKKHQVHYEIRTYHRFITLKKLTGSTASTYLEYIERNLPEGIGMKVSKLEVLPLPDYIQSSSPSPDVQSK